MTQHLLLFLLMYLCCETKAQASLPPKLTVNPAVITETDSVTLKCQPPSSVSVYQCQFNTLKGHRTIGDSSCLQTLAGTELMKMTNQRLPAEVQVKCFYTVKLRDLTSTSPDSETSSITIKPPRRPKLTVNPSMITETDSVTLKCQTPSSVSVSQCFFNFMKRKSAKSFSCLKTLTGTELLMITNQNSPAIVEVTCFYLVVYQSPESSMSSFVIQPPRPKLTVYPAVITETESVTVSCQTPSSVSVTRCYLYFVKEQMSRVIACLKRLAGAELLKMIHQSSPAEVEVTCYYIAERRGGQYQSLHSNTSSIIIQALLPPKLTVYPPVITETDAVTVKSQSPSTPSTSTFPHRETPSITIKFSFEDTGKTPSSMTQSMQTSTMATEPTSIPPEKPESGTLIRMLFVIVSGFGVTAGVILLTVALLCTKTSGKSSYRRPQANINDDLLHMNNTDKRGLSHGGFNATDYSVITSTSGVGFSLEFDQLTQNKCDTYHEYSSIADEPAASTLKDMTYSTLQAH